MNKLITSDISAGARMPLKQGTLEFLQQAYQQPLNALAQRIIGTTYDPTKAYVLYGLTGSSGSITAGALFFNGEVYLCDGDSSGLPCAGANVSVLNIAISQYTTNADPVTFSDGAIYDVHDIRKVAITCGASGSGDVCDYTDLVPVPVEVKTVVPYTTMGTGFQAIPNLETFSYTIGTDGYCYLYGQVRFNLDYTASGTTILSAGTLPLADEFVLFQCAGLLAGANTNLSNYQVSILTTGRLRMDGFGNFAVNDYIYFSGQRYKIA